MGLAVCGIFAGPHSQESGSRGDALKMERRLFGGQLPADNGGDFYSPHYVCLQIQTLAVEREWRSSQRHSWFESQMRRIDFLYRVITA